MLNLIIFLNNINLKHYDYYRTEIEARNSIKSNLNSLVCQDKIVCLLLTVSIILLRFLRSRPLLKLLELALSQIFSSYSN